VTIFQIMQEILGISIHEKNMVVLSSNVSFWQITGKWLECFHFTSSRAMKSLVWTAFLHHFFNLWYRNSILLYKFVKFCMNKRFWHYNFPVFEESSSLENENGVRVGGKSVTPLKMEIYCGKTSSPANLPNLYYRMFF